MNRFGKIVLVSFLISFSGVAAYSQEFTEGQGTTPDANVIYNQQAVGGVSAHTEGWGFFFRRAKILDIYKKIFWEAEAVTMHNEHEYKITNPNEPDASPYYFGKLNGMEALRLGGGISRMIWRKNDLSCVQIDAVYAAGFSLAVLKPVYLDILVNGPGGEQSPLPQKYDPNLDTPTNIYGRASVFDGIGELSFYPGLYGRAGLNFDFSNRHKSIKAIEAGVVVDAYKNVVPIMAFAKNNQVFANLYLSISFGKRWI
ncbi:MAG TPA: hypothetical protein VK808_12900 [Bacteroidia bacterium]|nr:hypothetical protein [Bacteroidia bacterium]